MGRKQDRLRKKKRHSDWSRKESEIRSLVRDDRFELTSHAYGKIETNYWSFEDVVASLLNGSIQKAEKDDQAVDGKKYTILGCDGHGSAIETVGKIVADDEGRLYLVITAY